ncbi:DNA repair helicase [Talaromyces pinophilus]|uniref:DNA repair helicase n=1 Tax=Talaromyces pinophilus TaxID=128442 RepID=A0A6V8H451_TALPI|nr:DNA repair helicase [Talaromyces pinophilus]
MDVDATETAPFNQAIKECARMSNIDPSMTTSEEDSGLTEMAEIDATTHHSGVIQDNHVEACQKLGIEDPEHPRVLGMQITERLKFWQPVAIWRIVEIRSNCNIRGAILADGFGLGKTWIITGYLLHLLNEYENKVQMAQQNRQPLPQGKPILIVVPPNLLIPWAKEIARIVRRNRFKIFIYKCVIHEESAPKHTTHLTRPMERVTVVSDTSPYGADTIILTTYQSFGQRHGAGAVKKWQRENNLPVVDKPKEMPAECPYNLSGCFSMVILDEAHMARNNSKPIWDDLEDEHDLDVSTTNPFEVVDDHPAAIGRFTIEAVTRYILRRGISTETAGASMRKILQELMIRRTYSSRIPFESGPTIGSEIPLAHRKKIEVEWENVEKTCYQKISKKKALLNGSMVTKNAVYEFYRGVPYRQSPSSIRATTKLELLLRGSPKLRALLPIVTEQVLVHREKAIVWCAFPATQVFVCAALREAQIDAYIHVGTAISIELLLKGDKWSASKTRDEMQAKHGSDLIETFNTKPDECMVLVCLYGVGASGLNLQSMCRNVHLFDAARSQAAVDHAIGRICRLGQSHSVLVHEYRLKKSFHDEMILRNRRKARPGMVTDLSTTIFKDLLEGDNDSDGSFAALDHKSLAKWVVREGALVELDEDEEPQEGDSQDTEEILDLLAEMVQDHMC